VKSVVILSGIAVSCRGTD